MIERRNLKSEVRGLKSKQAQIFVVINLLTSDF